MIYLLAQSALLNLLTDPATPVRERMLAAQDAGSSFAMSAVTLAELEALAERVSDDGRLRQVISQLQLAVEVLPWPVNAASILGRFPRQANASPQDLQVAAHALAIGAEVIVAAPGPWPQIPTLSFQDWARQAAPSNPG